MVQSLAEQVTSDVGGKRVSEVTSAEQLAGFVHGNVLPALKNEELGKHRIRVRQQLAAGPVQPEQAAERVPDALRTWRLYRR